MRRRTVGAGALAACLMLAACTGEPSDGAPTASSGGTSEETTSTMPPSAPEPTGSEPTGTDPASPGPASPGPTSPDSTSPEPPPDAGTLRPLPPPSDALAAEARDLCARIIAGELGRQGDASILAGSVARVDVIAKCASTSTKGMAWPGGPPGEYQVQFAAVAVAELLDVLADRPRDRRTQLAEGETCAPEMRPRTAYLVHVDGQWIVPDLLGEAGPCAMQYYPDRALVARAEFRTVDS